MRAGYLLEKLKVAQTKVNTLEKENEATKVRDLKTRSSNASMANPFFSFL